MTNLDLWKSVEKTPPEQTKKITGRPYQGTSPKPHWLIWKATETFGPCGIGWGFEIVEEKVIDGAMLEPGFYERIHMARVKVWYKWGEDRGEIEHVGQTMLSGRRKSRDDAPGAPYTDEDAPKKSVTDALIKALSMIGFAGDIFMGRYDDSKYVADLKAEAAETMSRDPSAAKTYVNACLAIIREERDADALKQWWNDQKGKRREHQLSPQQVETLKDAVVTRLDLLTNPPTEYLMAG